MPGFARIFVNTFMFSIGLWAAGPLFLLYTVRDLGASEAWLGAYGAVGNLATIFGYLFWRRHHCPQGRAQGPQVRGAAHGPLPAAGGARRSLTLILVLAGLNGLVLRPASI